MKGSDKSTILIIDDKSTNIYALEKLLEMEGRNFITSTTGLDGLKLAISKDVDLIILDVQMPEMDGFEVAQILRSNKRTKNIPIIFASAEKKEHHSILKGFEEGAIDYLFKPLDPEVTKAKVSVLLKIQKQKKELVEKNLSLEKSALLINNSADIIGILNSKTLKFEEINDAFTEILGYPKKIATTSPLPLLLSSEDIALVEGLSKKENERFSFETRIYAKDRSLKWLAWHVVAKDTKWFVNARDITEVKQVEKIRTYVSTVVKQSSDAIYIHDNEGRIISWNEGAEKIYGYTESEALNMKIWNIIPEYIQPSMQKIMNNVMNGIKIEFSESKRITKHGKLTDILFSASLIIDPDTNQKSVAITERDITDQKIATEEIKDLNTTLQENLNQLESTNNELESFSYSVSHDLRAPLRSLDSYAKILEEEYGATLDPEAKRLLQIIQRNSGKMNKMIDDMLEFSRLGKKEIIKSEINFKELVTALIHDISNSTQHHAEFKILELLPTLADQTLIGHVWSNLISNALKYSSKKERPLIEIGSSQQDGEIIYYIKDNGAGFSMEFADNLFGVFQRLHKATEFEGTGVGLAIVQRIITRHNGRVWGEGKINEGATFCFSLPG